MSNISKKLILFLTASSAQWATAITPTINLREEAPKYGSVYLFQVRYFKGLASRIDAAMGHPNDWTAVDVKLQRSKLDPRARRSIFAFLSDPWCNDIWPSIDWVRKIAKTVDVPEEHLIQPDKVQEFEWVQGERTKGNFSPRFADYLRFSSSAGCSGAMLHSSEY